MACFYSNLDTTLALQFVPVPNSVFEVVRQLRQQCQETSNHAWSTATLLLETEQFRMDYGYEPIPIEREIERKRAWKKYLPE